jgi:predicted transcriptional regulator
MSDEDKVVNFLKEFPRGLSIEELSSKTKLKRHQVKVILARLEGAKKIEVRKLGNVQLNYWKHEERRKK